MDAQPGVSAGHAATPAARDPASGPARAGWFPVAFARDLTSGSPRRVTVDGEGFCLFRSDDGARVAGVTDRCPHRGARLSDGRVRGDRIECLYHGWQFDGSGRCLDIPQLPSGQSIPTHACTRAIPAEVRQGMVWIWTGCKEAADPASIPTIPELDAPDCHVIDFAMDLPYDQEYLIENVLDYAHIHVAHDGVRGGGHRHLAGPIRAEIQASSRSGFEARLGPSDPEGNLRPAADADARVRFVAPTLVHYDTGDRASEQMSGLALYSTPLASGRCRLLYRAYGDRRHWSWRDRLRPRWLEHRHQVFLLEQDMAVVAGQAEEIRRSTATPASFWLPLKTSDNLVIHYRKWIEEHEAGRPDHIGLRQRGPASFEPSQPQATDRWSLHVSQCSSCRTAWKRLRTTVPVMRILGAALLAVAVCTPGAMLTTALAAASVVAITLGEAAEITARQMVQSPNGLSPGT